MQCTCAGKAAYHKSRAQTRTNVYTYTHTIRAFTHEQARLLTMPPMTNLVLPSAIQKPAPARSVSPVSRNLVGAEQPPRGVHDARRSPRETWAPASPHHAKAAVQTHGHGTPVNVKPGVVHQAYTPRSDGRQSPSVNKSSPAPRAPPSGAKSVSSPANPLSVSMSGMYAGLRAASPTSTMRQRDISPVPRPTGSAIHMHSPMMMSHPGHSASPSRAPEYNIAQGSLTPREAAPRLLASMSPSPRRSNIITWGDPRMQAFSPHSPHDPRMQQVFSPHSPGMIIMSPRGM
jgi:hypothetical protein